MDDPDLLVLAGRCQPEGYDDAAWTGERNGADADGGATNRLRGLDWRRRVFRGAGPGRWTGALRRTALAAAQTGRCQILDF